jgi:hypothetical protein
MQEATARTARQLSTARATVRQCGTGGEVTVRLTQPRTDWSVPHPGSFIPREKALDSHLAEDRVRPRNNMTLAVNQTTIPRTSNPPPIHYST